MEFKRIILITIRIISTNNVLKSKHEHTNKENDILKLKIKAIQEGIIIIITIIIIF